MDSLQQRKEGCPFDLWSMILHLPALAFFILETHYPTDEFDQTFQVPFNIFDWSCFCVLHLGERFIIRLFTYWPHDV